MDHSKLTKFCGDGLAARDIEDLIAEQLGIPKRVTFRQKIAYLRDMMDGQAARKELLALASAVEDELSLPETDGFTPSFYSFLPYQGPAIKQLPSFRLAYNRVHDIADYTLLKGNVVVLKGGLMVLENSGHYRAYNLFQFKGWEIRELADGEDYRSPVSLVDLLTTHANLSVVEAGSAGPEKKD